MEKYLDECLNSLVEQTLKEIEIICINDGSTDNSLKIIKSFAKKDKRIVIINKSNSGYGKSMNMGLDKATGEYIGIVESDDFVAQNAFYEMYKIAKKNDIDVVKANFHKYMTKKGSTGTSELFLKNEIGRVIDPRKHRHIFYQQPSIWSAIYKRSFLNDNEIRFLPSAGASYQDAGFNFKVFAMAKKVFFMDEAFLFYRQDNPNSSVKSDGKIYAVKDEYDEVERFLKERDLMEEFGSTLAIVRMGGYIWNMRRLTKSTALEFAKVVKSDYIRYKEAGYFDSTELDKDAEFIVNNPIIVNPERFVKTRFMYELKDKMKTELLGVYKIVNKRMRGEK